MLVIPDPDTAVIDPFITRPTLSLICNIVDPITKEDYTRDPRNIARKAEAYLKSTGIADTAYFGPEAEFFIFDDVRYDGRANSGFFYIDSAEGTWNTGREENPNLGYKPRHKEGYFPVPPTDSQHDLRDEMVRVHGAGGTADRGAAPRGGHRRAGRDRHAVRHAGEDGRRAAVVQVHLQERRAEGTARPSPSCRSRSTATTAPGCTRTSPSGRAASRSSPATEYGGLSKMALWYIGGILKHARALCAFSNPTTNSYKRLVPGFEAPVNLAYSSRNRSAAVRIPMYSADPKAKRVEFRTPDPSCNGYLAFAAMLMAGLDGVQNKIDPGQPLDKDIYGLSPEELANVPSAPGSLEEALKALEEDHEFLLKGDVFTLDVIEKWIEYKIEAEVNPVKLRPHPHEFSLYFDC